MTYEESEEGFGTPSFPSDESGIRYSLKVIGPDSGIDYKMIRITPDPKIDYEIVVIDPKYFRPIPELNRQSGDARRKRLRERSDKC